MDSGPQSKLLLKRVVSISIDGCNSFYHFPFTNFNKTKAGFQQSRLKEVSESLVRSRKRGPLWKALSEWVSEVLKYVKCNNKQAMPMMRFEPTLTEVFCRPALPTKRSACVGWGGGEFDPSAVHRLLMLSVCLVAPKPHQYKLITI